MSQRTDIMGCGMGYDYPCQGVHTGKLGAESLEPDQDRVRCGAWPSAT